MPAQMSHVNKLLAVHKQQQKRRHSTSVPNPRVYTRPWLRIFLKEGVSPLLRNHHPPLKIFKNKTTNWKKGRKAPRLRASQGSRDSLLSEWEAEMVGAIQSHSCLGSSRALLSFQKPFCTQTHLDTATWSPSSRGGRPGCSGSPRCRSLEGRQASPQRLCHPMRLNFQIGQ